MTRGRKKDLTIPPTRSLVQQRDYRARKASYIANLEERCRKAEDENAQLRQELMQARARLMNPAIVSPETVEASKELLQSLALASSSLAKYQRLAFPETEQIQISSTQSTILPPINFPTLPENPTRPLQTRDLTDRGKKHFYVDNNTPPFSPSSQYSYTPNLGSQSPEEEEDDDDDEEEECCGGMLDCDALGCDGVIEQTELRGDDFASTRPRLSGLRSTSYGRK